MNIDSIFRSPMPPILFRAIVVAIIVAVMFVTEAIHQGGAGGVFLLFFVGWIVYKIFRLVFGDRYTNNGVATHEHSCANHEECEIALERESEQTYSGNYKPFLPALFILGLGLLFSCLEYCRIMGFKSAHSFVLTPIYFAIAAYFLYKIYNEGLLRYAPWREWQGLPPLNEDAIKSVESPRGGKKISGPSPLVKHLAFLLNTFLFMASPVLMALFFELLPDYMSGVRRSGAESAGTAYAILLILTVGIGLLILLLYAIVGTAGVLLSRFRKGPK